MKPSRLFPAVLAFLPCSGHADLLASYRFDGGSVEPSSALGVVASNATAGSFDDEDTAGAPVGLGGGYGFSSFTNSLFVRSSSTGNPGPSGDSLADAITDSSYFAFTLTADGADVELGRLDFNYWITNGGTSSFSVHLLSDALPYLDGNSLGAATIDPGSSAADAASQLAFSIDLSSLGTLADGISREFRLYVVDDADTQNAIHRIDDIEVHDADTPPPIDANLLTNGGFEEDPFDLGWDSNNVVTETGLNGSPTAARLGYNTIAQLGQAFDPLADFTLDAYVEVAGNSTSDSFHLHLDTDGGPAIEVRGALGNVIELNQGGSYGELTALADGSPFPIPGNTPVRLRIIGRDFGTLDAEYDLVWSNPGETTLSHAATGLQAFVGPDSSAFGGVTGVRFDRIGNSGHSYWVDDVTLTAGAGVPPTADHDFVAPVPDKVVNIAGVYPHLAMTNDSNECGPGAVVPWADRLWAVTYSPHSPNGSSSKLYEIDTALNRVIRPESLGGTPANRFIHLPSNQLVIGPHFIDASRNVRNLPYSIAPGRHTGVAAHLDDPDNRIYIMTMENAVYDVDVHDLSVITRYPDVQGRGDRFLHGYHGKGLYSGQGLLVASNNGRPKNQGDPTGEAGVLATWDGTTVSDNGGGYLFTNDPNTGIGDDTGAPVAPQSDFIAGWNQVAKVQTCEVTGPGGIFGNPNPETDPIWTTGFDAKSVILRTLESGVWHTWRLPKGSYTHDGSHGWHTEWPRIRQIDPDTPGSPYLMHMHGLFFDFPAGFSASDFSGLAPLCGYYKMPVDYCSFNGELVIAKNDASKFSNALASKAQSNFWWGQLSDLADWGAPTGHGAVWMNEPVDSGQASDPFLTAGFGQGTLHLRNEGDAPVPVAIQTSDGSAAWTDARTLEVPANGYLHDSLDGLGAPWIRLRADAASPGFTAFLHLSNPYPHAPVASLGTDRFAALADIRDTTGHSDGIVRVMPGDDLLLEFASGSGYHRIGGPMVLQDVDDAAAEADLRADGALGQEWGSDAASAWIDEDGTRFRLPMLDPLYDAPFLSGWARGEREAVTERKLFNLHGTFYEVPRDNSGGKRKMRALATHGKRITDFASWRGLFVLTGVLDDAAASDSLVRNDTGEAALWLGEVDDLWQMGEPRGTGGPWLDTAVAPGEASDPYLMYGYDHKELELRSEEAATFTVEVDFLADDTWSTYRTFELAAGEPLTHTFPAGFHAHWVRVVSDTVTTATAQFTYGPAEQRDPLTDWARNEGLPTASGRTAVAEANGDGDALNDLAEFVLGTDPSVPNGWPVTTRPDAVQIVVRDLAPEDGITIGFETTTGLVVWEDGSGLVGPDPDQSGVPAGFTRLRFPLDPASEPQRFVRMRIELGR